MLQREMRLFRLGIFALVILLACASFNGLACELDLRSKKVKLYFPPKMDTKQAELDYAYQLLHKVLEVSEARYGPCELELVNNALSLKRIEHLLEQGEELHVGSFTVTQERDKRFEAVPIPISYGLRGYRLLLIKKGNQSKFEGIKDLQQLSTFTAGQGDGWADSSILQYNKLPVVEAGSISTIIDMLTYNRFDYFPRGALETVTELNKYIDKPVQLEAGLVLIYPSLSVFYVNKANEKLKERLAFGLNILFESGQFRQFFENNQTAKTALDILDLNNRTSLFLCNPYLPDWVPLNKQEYWLQPWPDYVNDNKCL